MPFSEKCGSLSTNFDISGKMKVYNFSYAKESIEWSVETGIINGYGGRLSPKAPTTRAEFARVLYNLMTK